MTQNWDNILTEYDEQEQVADTLPRVRVVTGSPAVTVLDARLAEILGPEDWAATTDERLVHLVELYMVETIPEHTETGFLGRVKVYRPPQDGGNIVIGPVDEFGATSDTPGLPHASDILFDDYKPITQADALKAIKEISADLARLTRRVEELEAARTPTNAQADGWVDLIR